MRKKRIILLLNEKENMFFNIEKYFFLFTFFFVFQLGVFAQNPQLPASKKVSFEINNQSLATAFKKIEEVSGCKVVFDEAEAGPYRVSCTVRNKPVREALSVILSSIEGRPFLSRISGTAIQIIKTATGNEYTKAYGNVVDANGNPLPGANIRVKGTITGATSSEEGDFTIMIPKEGNPVLVFSFVGMDGKEIPYTGGYLNVKLSDGTILSDVVVTGIFNKAKESYTGAATSISSVELENAGNRSVLTSIRNIDPSFNISDDITIGSDPNSLPTIVMRGASSLPVDVRDLQTDAQSRRAANQPIIILNGFEISLSRLIDMDENQIENITLLKDASATAMYGTRGSNGVVVVTTKKPKQGRLLVTYKGSLNIEAPDLTSYDLMNAKEKLAYEQAAGLYDSRNAIYRQELQDLHNNRLIDAERGVDTYWLKYPVHTGVGSRHSVALEGGEEKFRYSAGLSYSNIAGAMKGSERNAFNGNMFFQYRIKNFTFQNDLQVSSTKSINSPYGSFGTYGGVNSYWTPYDSKGNLVKKLEDYYYLSLATTNSIYNPLYNAYLPSKNTSDYIQILNNFSVEWYVLPELFFRGQFGVSSLKSRSDVYTSAEHTMFDDYVEEDYERKGRYTYGTGESSRYEGQITINYSKTFNDKHQVFAGLGWTLNEETSENYSITGEGISVINMDFLGMASKYLKDGRPSGTEGITRAMGFLLNSSYIYDRRYFIDINGKYEGSSQFGTNKRFAPFWSAGLGWNLYNEAFLKDNSVINVARLRLSYGVTGSQAFSPYLAMTTYQDFGGKSYRGWYGVYLMALGNSDLAWQKTNQYNLGTEWEMFDNRFRLNVDVYDKITDNLLTSINLPTSSGFSSYKANVGKVENRGIEVSANLFVLRNREKNYSWAIGGTLAHNKNEIKEISNSLQFLNNELLNQTSSVNPSFLYKEGESINTIYAVKSKGIDPSNGKEIYIKADGSETYTWDAKDMAPCGVAEPTAMGTLNTTFRYKGWNLSAYFSYRLGGQIYNHTLASKVENIYPYNNADRRVFYDRWKAPGDVAKFKSVTDFSTTNATSRFVMDENTFAFQTINLGYDFPSAWTKQHLSIQYLSVKGYLEDILYLSTIRRERGLDYPFSRKFSLSLTARF
jgi:TonB-linked SusC/RagA family outer membrane protein